jgi:hypothetical protein
MPVYWRYPSRKRTKFPEWSLLAVDANEVTEIAVPAENGANDIMELWEIHMIRD